MIVGQSYRYNFLGFPGGVGVYRGMVAMGPDAGGDSPLWFEFEVANDSMPNSATHPVYMNPALLATILPV